MTSEKMEKRKRKRWFYINIVILLCLIALLIQLNNCSENTDVIIAEIIEQKEPNAQRFENNVASEEKIEHPDGGGGVQITYSTQVNVDFKEGAADLIFANPAVSDQNMTLQIMLGNAVIAQSGQIEPGHMLSELKLLIKKMPVGIKAGQTYAGEFYIQYYDEKTQEIAQVDTRIPVSITVK